MNSIGSCNLSGRDDAVWLKVAVFAGSWPNTYSFISQLDMHGVDIGLRVDGYRCDAELAAGADDAKGDFTAVSDKDFLEHEGMIKRLR